MRAGAIPKWLREWITKMMPSQHSSGEGAVNIGRMRDSNKTTHIHVTNHIYATPPAAPAKPRARYANEAQREVLRFLVGMRPHDGVVFDFMEREFGTRFVIDLDDIQLKRARRYAETVKARAFADQSSGQGDAHARHEFL